MCVSARINHWLCSCTSESGCERENIEKIKLFPEVILLETTARLEWNPKDPNESEKGEKERKKGNKKTLPNLFLSHFLLSLILYLIIIMHLIQAFS